MGGEDKGIAPTCLLSRLGQLRLEVLFSSLSGAILAQWLYRGYSELDTYWLNLMNVFYQFCVVLTQILKPVLKSLSFFSVYLHAQTYVCAHLSLL